MTSASGVGTQDFARAGRGGGITHDRQLSTNL